ncbi:MAG TPA: hypothetical protein VF131_13285 [Blastocatellia bacterium]|nr:hypothetical protein [Blastocatellia bacterium]
MSVRSKSETSRLSSCDPSGSSAQRSSFKTTEEMIEYLERILPPTQYVPAKKSVGSLSYEELLHMMGSRGSKAA